jgi:hypothetical protein
MSDQTCPASQSFPELTKHIWLLGRIPEAFHAHVRPQPEHVWPNPISQQLSPGPNISGLQVGFQRGWPDFWVSDTPTARFSWGL